MIGNRVRVKVVKNKIAPPFKEAEFDIMFGKGISKEGDILDLAAKEDIVEKSGAWYAYNGSKIGQGRENAKNFLLANQELCAEIENKGTPKIRIGGRSCRRYGREEGQRLAPVEKKADAEPAQKNPAK